MAGDTADSHHENEGFTLFLVYVGLFGMDMIENIFFLLASQCLKNSDI